MEEVIEYIPPNKEDRIEEFKKRILEKGDKFAYGRLFEIFADSVNPYDLYSYSLLMVNKFNDYEYPCRDIFYLKLWKYNQNTTFLETHVSNIDNLPDDERIELIKILQKCGEGQSHEAIELLISYYSHIRDQKNLMKWINKRNKLPERKW